MFRKHCLFVLMTGLFGVESIPAQQGQNPGIRTLRVNRLPSAAEPRERLADHKPRTSAEINWPQFRGVQAGGVGLGNPPIEWDIESGKNIVWKRRIAGLGHSCTIAFGKRVFMTTAVNVRNEDLSIPTGFLGGTGEPADDSGDWQWQIACCDLNTGTEIWKRTVATGEPAIKRHIKATHANCTPATDGAHVVAFFGSEGLYCLDMKGNLIWKKDFGKLHSGPYDAPDLEWGFGSSPIIHQGKVIVQCDCINTGFVAILDVDDGTEMLRIDRDDVATWSTPMVLKTETEWQLVCNGYRQMAGYDLKTGDQLWTLSGGGDVPVPTPLTAHGLIFLSNGHGRSPVYAISPSARGDITPRTGSDGLPDGLVWWRPRGGSYIPTPVIVGEYLYTCNDRGVLTVRDAKSGAAVYRHRVGDGSGTFTASAVATENQIYFSSEGGDVSVVKTGPDYELLGRNEVQEPILATPAIVGDLILLRTTRHLYCIGNRD